jgi:hypothetical protein
LLIEINSDKVMITRNQRETPDLPPERPIPVRPEPPVRIPETPNFPPEITPAPPKHPLPEEPEPEEAPEPE